MLRFQCQECRQKIKVQAERRGRRVRCPRCDAVQVVPLDAAQVTYRTKLNAYDDVPLVLPDTGGTIYMHQPPRRNRSPAESDAQGLGQLVAHVERNFGAVKTVLHEVSDDRPRIDAQYILPSKQRPFTVLVTLGMSGAPMAAPQRPPSIEFAELLLALPPNWPLTQEGFEHDETHWPIKTLLGLARQPHVSQTGLSRGEVAPHGDPPRPYAPDTAFCGSILLPPTLFGEAAGRVEIHPGKIVHFLGVVPVYREELNLARKRGPDALMRRLTAAGVSERLDPGRRNVAAKRFRLFRKGG